MIVVSFGMRDADVATVANIQEWERGGEYRGPAAAGAEPAPAAAATGSNTAGATSAPSATLGGTPDADSTVVCSRVAMKLALLAGKFRQAMVRYEYAHRIKEAMKMNSMSSTATTTNARQAAEDAADAMHFTRLMTHIGVHSCDVPVSSLKPPELRPGYIAQTMNTYGGVLGTTDEQDGGGAGKHQDAGDSAAARESKTGKAKQRKRERLDDDDGSRSDSDDDDSDDDDSDIDDSDDLGSSDDDDDNSDEDDGSGGSGSGSNSDAEEAARARALAEGSFFRSSATSATAPERKRRVTKLSRAHSTNGQGKQQSSALPRKRNSASGALDGGTGKYTRRASRRANKKQEEEAEAKRLRRRRRRKRRRRRRRRKRREKGEGGGNAPLEETDTSLIYKINDTHVDFAIELSWMCREMRREVVLSPQALLMISKSSHVDMKKDIIVRDLDVLRANAFPTRPRLKVFELIAFEHVGSHDPGVLKAIRHYETGIKAYRARKFRDAMISFQHAISIANDPPSLVMHQRSAHYLRHPPPLRTWQGEFELSESAMVLT